jgi:hypothetical protein
VGRPESLPLRRLGLCRDAVPFAQPRLERDRLAIGLFQPPLRREPPSVLAQELRCIDAVADKCAAAEMVHKQIVRHGQLKPSRTRPP